MSNFTRSGGRAKKWQSITNLSCCSIGQLTKPLISMKALAFIVLFAFSSSAMFASELISGCMSEAPEGPTAEMYALSVQCEGNVEVVKTTQLLGDDCEWEVIHSYQIKCDGQDLPTAKIHFLGGDDQAPTLVGDLPSDVSDLNLCFNAIPAGPTEAEIAALYSDNCSDVFVTKTGTPIGNDCEWSVKYLYTIRDACFNFAAEFEITISGGDIGAPQLVKDAVLPTGEDGLNLCFDNKAQGPTEAEIAALFEDNCGNVNVTKTGTSKGNDCKWLAIYTYTIQDDCENFADQLVLSYSGGDYQDPEIFGAPGDETVSCRNEIPKAPKLDADDNCATNLEVILTENLDNLGLDCEGGFVVRTWTTTDDCGRTDTKTQTITVLPAPPADWIETPANKEISCVEADGYQPELLFYSNGVEGGLCSINGEATGVLEGTFDECGGNLIVTWSFEDECGRAISHVQDIIVLPAPAAQFINPPQDMQISCEQANLYQAISIAYSNGLDGPCGINGEVPGELSGSYTECGGTLYVDWFFKDDCDREITYRKTITVEPAPAAEFDEVANMTISCEEANNYVAGSLGYTNNGTGLCEISGSVPGELSGSYTECGGTLIVDWYFKDACDREIFAQKVITVEPAPAAEFDEVANMTISCEEANNYVAGSLGYTNNGTGLCEISGSVEGELSGSYTECGGTLVVDWYFKDACDREIFAQKVITVEPAPAAEFDEVANMTISCEEANNYVAGSLGYTNNGTGLCEISGSVEGELSGSYTECGGTLIVDWYFKDACDREIFAQKVITVEPAPAAEFDPVENEAISCEEANNYVAGSLGYTNNGTGLCEISGSVQGELSGSYDECGGLLFVDWYFKDECDREITRQIQIKVEPAPAAEFDEVANMTISCEEANIFQPGFLAYTNNGTGACLIAGEVQGELSGSYTECGGTLIVDWYFKDACDREIFAQKVITVEPAPAAEFDEVANMTISCEEANNYVAGSLGYTNNGTGLCEISGSVPGELSGSYTECGGTLIVDWYFSDACDREIFAQKVITVEPAPAAEFDEVANMTISCEEANNYVAGSLGYTNNGTGLCEISGSVPGELSGSYTECGGTLIVDWYFKDACDREIFAQKVITVEPAPAAEFDEVANMTISCEEANNYVAESLGYTNNGTGLCEISGSVPGELSGSYTECGGTLIVDWYFKDLCDREIFAQKVITVEPAPAAEFDEVANMTISCEEANNYVAGSLGYTNNGTGLCEISGSVEGELSGSYTECGGTLIVDWYFKDACDRESFAQKIITVEPAPQAQFDPIENMTISCEEANNFQPSYLAYTNNGTGPCLITGEVLGELSGSYNECGGTLVVDWYFKDVCDRESFAQKIITVEPAPKAEFDPIENMTISCEEANNFQPGFLAYTNNGTGPCLIAGEVQGELSGSYTECGGTLIVDWYFKDLCDRESFAQKIITVEPAPQAQFDPIENMTISCEEANNYVAGSLGYTNNGTGLCEISGSVPGELSGSYTECGGTLVVDWYFKDACDREIFAQKIITVEPAPQAQFDPVENMTISCEEANIFQPGYLAYTNNGTGPCLIAGEVLGELSGEYNECGGTLVVDWYFKDACDRESFAQKVITVEPAPQAQFDPVENMTISCEEANIFQPGYLAYTNNGTGPCLIAGEVLGELSGEYNECGGTLVVDWYFKDLCDRESFAQKIITVEPAPKAEFDPIENMTISCEEANNFQPGYLAYTNNGTGPCLIAGEVLGELSGEYNECGGTLVVDWYFKDACDRESFAQKIITVEPAPQAQFDPVENMTISCEEANNFQPGYLAYTNNGTGPCLIAGEVLGELSGEYNECGGTLVVDWYFKDACDRESFAQKIITVEPAPKAEFDPVENMTISCEEAMSFQPGYLAYTNNGTGPCLIAGEVLGELSGSFDECGGTLVVDWYFKDLCDRESFAQKIITVEPAPPAVFDEIADANIFCEDLATYQPEFLSYSNGHTGICEISGSVQGVADPFEGSCGQFEVNFSFTDDCGRTITAKHTITVIDETAPTLEGVIPEGESNMNLCYDQRPDEVSHPFLADSYIASLYADNCGNVNVTHTIVELGDDCDWAIMYRYEIQDDCDNFADPVKIFFNGGDTSAPELTGDLPLGVSGLQCLNENPGAPDEAAIAAAFTDNCSDPIVIPLDPVIAGDDCGWTVTYEYLIEDACGNKADNVVIVNSGADTTPPTLDKDIPMGENTLNLCIDSPLGEPTKAEIAALYIDNCTDPLTEANVSKIEKVYGTDCEWIRVFEYIVSDNCGNPADLIKVNYQGGDVEAPTPTGECEPEVVVIRTDDWDVDCPADAYISLNVGDEITVADMDWTVGGITVGELGGNMAACFTDNCAEVSELTFRVTSKDGTVGTCSTILNVTFDVIDNCNNIFPGFVCTFVVVDNTAPVVTCPEGEDFGLVTETPTTFATKADYTDNCQPDGETEDYTDVTTIQFAEGSEGVSGFVGDFAEGNWALDLSNGSIVITPADMTITGNGNTIGGTTQATATCPVSGSYSFDWDYLNVEDAFWDPAFYVNGTPINLIESGTSGSGSLTVNCAAGDVIGFGIYSQDGIGDSATLTITNFVVGGTPDTFLHTLTRTFTANDGCDNTATCDVVYTWNTAYPTCDAAPAIACDDVINGDTSIFGIPVNIGNQCAYNGAIGTWYTFIGTGEIANFTTCSENTTYDTNLSAYTDCGDVCVTGNDDANCSHSSLHSAISFNAELGIEYKIFVSGFQSDTGAYELSVTCESLPECDYPELFCGDIAVGDTSDGGPEDVQAFGGTGNWYTFIGTGEDVVTFSTCDNADFDTRIDVYTGCIDPVWIAGNDDSCGLQSEIGFFAELGVEYNIFMRGFGGDTGNYGLTVICDSQVGEPRTTEDFGDSDEDVKIDFTAYPVPFNNEVNIAYTFEFETNVTIELFDTKGLLILSQTNEGYVRGSSDKTTFDLSRTANQMFYVKLTTSKGVVTKKIVSSSKNRR